MSHYEQRLEADLTHIRERVCAVAAQVDDAVVRAVRALLAGDRMEASEIILGDMPINREIRDIDRECHAFVARHLPSAGPLRFVSSVLRLNVAIERIGDYAVTIARVAAQLHEGSARHMARDIELMAEHSKQMLGEARHAFKDSNAEQARAAKAMANPASHFGRGFDDLAREAESGSAPIRDLLSLLTVFNMLERAIDQAKNICEETIFAVTGETKAPRRYQILFIDERNDAASQLAEAYARKAFPESGDYASAGWQPASVVDAACVSYLERNGVDTDGLAPSSLTASELSAFHIIVSVGGDPRAHIVEPPFRTVLLDWNVGPTDTQEQLEAAFKEIAHQARGLMETLRGDQAN